MRFVEHTRLHDLDAQALSVHGRILLEKGRLAEVRECIEQAIELCDKHLEERAMAEPHIVFGFWHTRHGEFGHTHQHIETYLPNNSKASLSHGICLVALSNCIPACCRS